MRFHICWAIDCESCRLAAYDPEFGRSAVRGFPEVLEDAGWVGTFIDKAYQMENASHDLGGQAALRYHVPLCCL